MLETELEYSQPRINKTFNHADRNKKRTTQTKKSSAADSSHYYTCNGPEEEEKVEKVGPCQEESKEADVQYAELDWHDGSFFKANGV